jgi:hypothetical protein
VARLDPGRGVRLAARDAGAIDPGRDVQLATRGADCERADPGTCFRGLRRGMAMMALAAVDRLLCFRIAGII